MRSFLAILAVVLSALCVCALDFSPPSLPAGDDVSFYLHLYDSDTLAPVENMHARLVFTDSKGQVTNTMKFIQDGTLKLNLAPELWRINIQVDDIDTPGKDYSYMAEFDLSSTKGEKVFLLPAGSVQGTVYSEQKAVPDADVLLYCSGDVVRIKTDISGSFVADWLPVGRCRINAVSGDLRGESVVKINKGSLSEVDVELSEGLTVNIDWVYVGLALALASVLTLVIVLFFRPRKPNKKHKRSDDVINALSDRERKVVELLISLGGRSTQASIKNESGIPKTTLLRIFQSLENRNIIYIEKIGKMKKISLSDWFLGKGKMDRDSASVA